MSTTTTETPASTGKASPANRRAAVGTRDLLWVTWRQHRSILVTTGVLCVLVAVTMLVASTTSRGGYADPWWVQQIDILAELSTMFLMAFGGLVAVFWAAPLLAREFEAGTHLLVWSQDVPARRLVWAKSAWLTLAAALLSLLIGGMALPMVAQRGPYIGLLEEPYFSAAPHVQLGYVLFGFALGLLVSVLARQTVLAMGVTLGGFLLTRFVVAVYLRPYYAPPVRYTDPLNDRSSTFPESYGMIVDNGILDRAGNPVDPSNCPATYGLNLRTGTCVSNYIDYQPVNRLDGFRLIETGIYVGLAVVLFLIAWRYTRRVTRL